MKIFDSKEQNDKFNRLWETDEGFREKILDVVFKNIEEDFVKEEGPGAQIVIQCASEKDPNKIEEETSYPAINYVGFKFHFAFEPKGKLVFQELLNDLKMQEIYLEKNLEKIKKEEDDQEEAEMIFSQSINRVKTTLTKINYTLKKVSSLPEEIVNFFILETVYPHAKASKLRGMLRSKTFIKKANRDFYPEFQQIAEDFEGDPDREFLRELERDLYYCFLNLRVLLLYEEENEKGLENFQRRQKTSEKPQKKLKDTPSVEPAMESPKEKKIKFSEEYLQSILEFVSDYVNSDQTLKRLEKYIVRIMQAAYVNEKPAPISSILDWIKNFVGIEIERGDEYKKIEMEALSHGYVGNEQSTKENTQKDTIPVILSSEKEKPENKEEKKPTPEIDPSDVTATKVMETFKEQGFCFENEKLFPKQFKNLLEGTAQEKGKKKKLGKLLVGEIKWESYPNNNYMMRVDAGGEALRIVRKRNEIRDFLNHANYEKKYVKNGFSL